MATTPEAAIPAPRRHTVSIKDLPLKQKTFLQRQTKEQALTLKIRQDVNPMHSPQDDEQATQTLVDLQLSATGARVGIMVEPPSQLSTVPKSDLFTKELLESAAIPSPSPTPDSSSRIENAAMRCSSLDVGVHMDLSDTLPRNLLPATEDQQMMTTPTPNNIEAVTPALNPAPQKATTKSRSTQTEPELPTLPNFQSSSSQPSIIDLTANGDQMISPQAASTKPPARQVHQAKPKPISTRPLSINPTEMALNVETEDIVFVESKTSAAHSYDPEEDNELVIIGTTHRHCVQTRAVLTIRSRSLSNSVVIVDESEARRG